jgi:hypothetical protein
MKSNFFMFASPIFNSIDSGTFFKRPFAWLYILMAILNWFVPVYFIIKLSDNNYLFEEGNSIILIGVTLLVLGSLIGSWLGFQLWWHRKGKLKETSSNGDEFVATPIFAHLFQTIGEWIGIWLFTIGVVVGFAALIGSSDVSYALGLGALTDFGFAAILIAPLASFFVILIFRFLAEQFRALAAIGNNTRIK